MIKSNNSESKSWKGCRDKGDSAPHPIEWIEELTVSQRIVRIAGQPEKRTMLGERSVFMRSRLVTILLLNSRCIKYSEIQ